MEWEKMLGLPAATLAGNRRIPKTQLVAQGRYTKREEKLLAAAESLTHVATLQKSNTPMLPVSDEEHDVAAILYLRCVMKRRSGTAELAELLHRTFPNPTVLLFEAEGACGVSVALKRKSLAEHGAVVVEQIAGTGWFDPDDVAYGSYLEAVAYSALPQATLLEFVRTLVRRTLAAKCIGALGFYPAVGEGAVDELMAQVRRMSELQTQIEGLQVRRRSRETSLADSTKLRVEIKKLEKERSAVAEGIKELCDGN